MTPPAAHAEHAPVSVPASPRPSRSSEAPPVAPPESPPEAPKIAPGSGRKKAAFALVALVVASGITFAALRPGKGGPSGGAPPAATRDVPSLSGKAIVYSPAFGERAGLKTARVQKAPLTPVLKLVGTVSFDPAHVAAVGSRIRGFVRSVKKVEGDEAAAGEPLAEIESSELGQAQADVVAALANKKAAETNAVREIDLLKRSLTTAREEEVARATLEQQKAMLAAAQQKVLALGGKHAGALGVYVVRSPIKGTVVERQIAPGQSVEANLTAFRVADLDHLWIELAVFERDLGAVRVGDPVEITPISDGDRKITGRVAHVGEVISLETRTSDVRVTFDNQARLVRPGQSVTAEVHGTGRKREALLVPASATTYIDGKATVFVADGDGRAVPTEVKLGATDGVNVEIVSGLAEGQTVISEGVFALKSELFR